MLRPALPIHEDDIGLFAHAAASYYASIHGADRGDHGTLVGHVARANPVWQAQGQQVLVVFQGPDGYISPNGYAAKQEHGKVVPTWNYAVVHAHCTLKAIHEPERVLQILNKLTDKHEADQTHPWRLAWLPFTQMANLTGLPAMSMPLFTSDDGLPSGVHFMGPMGQEGLLFSLAGQLEQAHPWAQRAPQI